MSDKLELDAPEPGTFNPGAAEKASAACETGPQPDGMPQPIANIDTLASATLECAEMVAGRVSLVCLDIGVGRGDQVASGIAPRRAGIASTMEKTLEILAEASSVLDAAHQRISGRD